MKTIVIHLFMHVKLCKQKLCKKVAFWVILLNRTIAQGQILELFYVNVFYIVIFPKNQPFCETALIKTCSIEHVVCLNLSSI